MTVADGSAVRLAYIAESVIGTTPSTPAFQVLRYSTSDLRITKQTDVPSEVRADRNVSSIVDVGRAVTGTINTQFSYSTYDDFLAALMCRDWATDVTYNGVSFIKTFTFETLSGSVYNRFKGCRINTLDMSLEARKPVTANFGIMGISADAPASSIISGATYTAATTTEVFNAGLNVSGLTISGITNSPKIQKMSLKITNNIYQNDIVGSYNPYSHGLGRFEVTGSITTYFENSDSYAAVLSHTTVALAFTLTDAAGNSYDFDIGSVKLMDGGPDLPGNGQPVKLEIPFQAFYDGTIGGEIKITRTDAS